MKPPKKWLVLGIALVAMLVVSAFIGRPLALAGSDLSSKVDSLHSPQAAPAQQYIGVAFFFEHDSYKGWKISEWADGICHNITWWKDNKMSSVISADNAGNTILYKDKNCRGASLKIPPGTHIPALRDYAAGWNDVASSIRVEAK